MKTLILVDIQNDFLPGGSLAVPKGDEILPVVNEILTGYDLVVATQDWHPPDHVSFASNHPGREVGDVITLDSGPQVLWPDHCLEDSVGAELSADLKTEAIHHRVAKGTSAGIDSYSGFFDNGKQQATRLEALLWEKGAAAIDIVGLATDYCVQFTASDAAQLGFRTRVLLPACRGVELKSGDIDRAVAAMVENGVEIVSAID